MLPANITTDYSYSHEVNYIAYEDEGNITMASPPSMLPNLTSDSISTDFGSGGVPTWYRSVLLCGYLLIIIVGLPANGMVLVITFFCNSSNSAVNTINTYISNLAFADLLYIFGAIFWAWTNYDQEWKFGELGCHVVFLGLDFITIHASAYTLTVMTIERYLVIMYPMTSLRCRNISVARNINIIVWVTAVVVALPPIIFMTEEAVEVPISANETVTKMTCKFQLGQDAQDAYYDALSVITFIIPSMLMITVYVKMFLHIFGTIRESDNPNENITRQLRSSSRRASKIVLLIVAIWLICYFPYWLNSFLYRYLPSKVTYDPDGLFHLIAALLTYLNSVVNPFLYTLMPKRYNVWKRLRCKPPPYEAPMEGKPMLKTAI